MEQLVSQLAPVAIEPLAEQLPAVIDAVLDAPMVGDPDEFYVDLQALEDARAAMQLHGSDIKTLTSTFFAEFAALDFGGDD